ncbi:MAG: hypothetical protein H0X24_01760, partial [Ktedonobacterales bacterium]|nr:hypothetical protein [Ktedonobacterales bacterium]
MTTPMMLPSPVAPPPPPSRERDAETWQCGGKAISVRLLAVIPAREFATHQVTHQRGYYAKYWKPRLLGSSERVIDYLWRRVSFNVKIWQGQGRCFPEYETIAAGAGLSRSTVARVLHRVQTEAEAAKITDECQTVARNGRAVRVGDFGYTYDRRWVGDLIGRWIVRIERRYRFDTIRCHSLTTSNEYHLAHIMPPCPQHDADVAALTERFVEWQCLAQRVFAQNNETHYAVSSCDVLRRLIMRLEITVLKKTPKKDEEIRSPQEGERDGGVATEAIRSNRTETNLPSPSLSSNGTTASLVPPPDHAQDRDRPSSIPLQPRGAPAGPGEALAPPASPGSAAPPVRLPATPEEDQARQHAVAIAYDYLLQNGGGQDAATFTERQEKCRSIAQNLVVRVEQGGCPYLRIVPFFQHLQRRINKTPNIANRARYWSRTVITELTTIRIKRWDLTNPEYQRERRKWELAVFTGEAVPAQAEPPTSLSAPRNANRAGWAGRSREPRRGD